MATLTVKKGASKALPGGAGGKFSGGLGWDAAKGTNPEEKIDLDLWILRYWKSGKVEAIYWGNEDWYDPNPAHVNKEGRPWVITPELDVIHKGDSTTGEESDTGYDEEVDFDLSKRPATAIDEVVKYEYFATYYDDPRNPTGNTLGNAENIVCGLKDEKSGHELKAEIGSKYTFEVTVLVATITADGQMTNNEEAFGDKSMVDVAKERGVVFTD